MIPMNNENLQRFLEELNSRSQRVERRVVALERLLMGILFCAIALCLGYFTFADMPKNRTWAQTAIADGLIILVSSGCLWLLRRIYGFRNSSKK